MFGSFTNLKTSKPFFTTHYGLFQTLSFTIGSYICLWFFKCFERDINLFSASWWKLSSNRKNEEDTNNHAYCSVGPRETPLCSYRLFLIIHSFKLGILLNHSAKTGSYTWCHNSIKIGLFTVGDIPFQSHLK